MWKQLLLVFTLIQTGQMVDLSKFKNCSQSGFCGRQRGFADLIDATGKQIQAKATDFQFDSKGISARVSIGDDDVVYSCKFELLQDAARFKMQELNPLHPRYETPFSLERVDLIDYKHTVDENGVITVNFGTGNRLEIHSFPFSFKTFKNGELAMVFNDRGYLYYEPYRSDNAGPSFAQPIEGGEESIENLKAALLKDLGSENFGGSEDSKPKGASSVGFDVTFVDTPYVYGIPEHATSFALKTTRGDGALYTEPYRMYNLDVFEHILDSPMALYGGIPYMMSHKVGLSNALLFLNSAEMWIDVEHVKYQEKLSTSSHWMAESGIIDVFLFFGPTQKDLFNTFTSLTGRPQLPQQFAVGHHSCRWNYISEEDALQVDAGFDEHEIPYDVLWLDIEHTDGKRYFTWDSIKFPNPLEMQKKIANKGRKMVTIIDPHIKKDPQYYLSKEASEADIFVKTKEGTVFDGHCWPGISILNTR
jgi:alpha 1,3-glucosidase